MVSFNHSTAFILTSIPGLETDHIWISIPFSMFYIVSLLGNFSILFVVAKEQTLQKPLYLLLCTLALTDIGMPTCVVPKALCIFWFDMKDITVDGCLFQMFFLQVFTFMNTAVLVTMAFDRYLAIFVPLRYATILTNARTAQLGLLGLILSVLVAVPEHLSLRRLPFCTNRVIPHTFCEHMAVVKLSCADTSIMRSISLIMTFVIIGLDLTLIGLSYGLIIRAVLSMNSKENHQKALNTCTAHISVIVISFTFSLFSSLMHRFGQGIAVHVHILLANFNVLFPAMINPIIYGVKTKELRDKLRKNTCRTCSIGAGVLKIHNKRTEENISL